ncbi:hypothetical protein [Rhodomicrobium vannielii]|uniref:hypothetical protein n=1 Tax=Rhodomicrobium vannielii TaxID=1069 RepID=UPI0005A1B9B7|nr:hypothetical protein [Rhodomicrobium vannielii]
MPKPNSLALPQATDQNDVAALALQAVDSIANLSNQYMTYTAVLLGVFALIGLGVVLSAVRWYAKDASKKCANEHMQRYIQNGQARELLAQLVDEAVQKEFSTRTFVSVRPQRAPKDGGPRFTEDPKSKRSQE